jgi:hypothetical protein
LYFCAISYRHQIKIKRITYKKNKQFKDTEPVTYANSTTLKVEVSATPFSATEPSMRDHVLDEVSVIAEIVKVVPESVRDCKRSLNREGREEKREGGGMIGYEGMGLEETNSHGLEGETLLYQLNGVFCWYIYL